MALFRFQISQALCLKFRRFSSSSDNLQIPLIAARSRLSLSRLHGCYLGMRERCRQACETCRARKSRCLPGKSADICRRCEEAEITCVPHDPLKRRTPKRRKKCPPGISLNDGQRAEANTRLDCVCSAPHGCLKNVLHLPDGSFGQDLLTVLRSEAVGDKWPRFRALGVAECQAYLQHYDRLIQAVPFAFHRPKLSIEAFMTESPLFFLSVILTASSSCQVLEAESESIFRHILADRVVIRGQRSLELLQSLLTYLIYHPHRHNHDTQQYFQFLHLALAMAADLGLYTRFRHPRSSLLESENDPNVARAFLLCYYLSCGTGILGYDRPDTMRCIQSLRYAAQHLAQRSSEGFDREAPALVGLLYILAQHHDHLSCPEKTLPQSWNLAAALEDWKATYPTASTLSAIKSMQHFAHAYGLLKCARPGTLSNQDRQVCVDNLALVLSNVLERGAAYLMLFGAAEWGHVLTTLFLLPRVETSTGQEGAPLTLEYIGRFRQTLQEARTLATQDIVLATPTFFGWLDRILSAVEKQTTSHLRSSVQTQQKGDESAYELINSFIDDESNQGSRSHRGRDRDQEEFWGDFMSEWLNW